MLRVGISWKISRREKCEILYCQIAQKRNGYFIVVIILEYCLPHEVEKNNCDRALTVHLQSAPGGRKLPFRANFGPKIKILS